MNHPNMITRTVKTLQQSKQIKMYVSITLKHLQSITHKCYVIIDKVI